MFIVVCTAVSFFFFNDTATTEIYTLSLHDALPIFLLSRERRRRGFRGTATRKNRTSFCLPARKIGRATSELQSLAYLVCRLLLEKKKKLKLTTIKHLYTTNTTPLAPQL